MILDTVRKRWPWVNHLFKTRPISDYRRRLCTTFKQATRSQAVNLKHFLPIALVVLVNGCSSGPDDLRLLDSGAKISRVISRQGDNVTSESGGGVYIGNNTILTAAHVVNGSHDGDIVSVALGSSFGLGVISRQQTDFKPGHNDLAVIKLVGTWSLPRGLPICELSEEKDLRLLIVSFRFLYIVTNPDKFITIPRFSVQGQYEQGTSGSAVIDRNRQCITGIASYSLNMLNMVSTPCSSMVTDISKSGTLLYTPATEITNMLEVWGVPHMLSK